MPILLLRHAKAGSRLKWDGPSHLRPLSEKGRIQAEALVPLYEPYAVSRVLTSAHVRCEETVTSLAKTLALPVEGRGELAEGTGSLPTLELMRSLAGATAVLCTHGDVVLDVLDALEERYGLELPPNYPCAKAGTWVLDGDPLHFDSAAYLPPP